jgi:hypothetical protein
MSDHWHFKEYIEAWEKIIFIPILWVLYLALKLFDRESK